MAEAGNGQGSSAGGARAPGSGAGGDSTGAHRGRSSRNRRWRRKKKPDGATQSGGASAAGQNQGQNQNRGQGPSGSSRRSPQNRRRPADGGSGGNQDKRQEGGRGTSRATATRGSSSGPSERSDAAGGQGRASSSGRRGRRRRTKKSRPQQDGGLVTRQRAEQDFGEPKVFDGSAFFLPKYMPDEDGDDVSAVMADEWDDMGEVRGNLYNVAWAHVQGGLPVQMVDSHDLTLRPGDRVVVDGDRGQAAGVVVTGSVRRVMSDRRLARVLRHFDKGDIRQESRTQRRAQDAFVVGSERIKGKSLPMKLVGVDYLHGGNKAIFYFVADGRVDFRDLIRDLARTLRVRIEMRQIGIRDEAGVVGGLGTCGQELCCHRFLQRFEQVSIRMAKDQNLVLNPQKISGQCGRLKCCLAYEHSLYQELGKNLPRQGKRIETPKGMGRVADLDILNRRVRVNLQDGGSEVFAAEELGYKLPDGSQQDR